MQERKISFLHELKPGDHVKYNRTLQNSKKKTLTALHHALVVRIENNAQMMVIHNSGKEVEEKLVEMDASYIIVLDYECVFSGAQAIARARTRLGDGYSMLRNNCEHFVTWARTGKAESQQVKEGYGAGLIGFTSGAVTGAAFGTVGIVAGGVLGLFGGIFAYLVCGNRNHLELH